VASRHRGIPASRHRGTSLLRSPAADGLVSSVDLAPTILEVAGVPIPATVQGRSSRGYAVVADPQETVNLATDPRHAATLADLLRRLEAWGRGTGDVMPTCRTPDEFDRATGKVLADRKLPHTPKADVGCPPRGALSPANGAAARSCLHCPSR
jgi:hypothetical protein